MRTCSSTRGFSLTELMIASLVCMVVMSVTFRAFQDALTLNDVATQMTDASQNLRAGSNLLTRDLLEAGRNIPIGGIAIPSGDGTTAIHRPGPDASQVFDNGAATTLPTIATAASKGPVINGKATDFITMVMDDPFLGPLTVYPSTNVTSVAKLAPDGSSVNVGPNTAWIAGNTDPSDFVAPVKAGELMYFNGPSGTAIQTVTSVDTATMTFAPGDPFNFNQRGAPAGSITQILTDPSWTVRRVLMFTYYVHEDEPGVPRLMRQLNFYSPQALAGVIEDLELSYDLVDGTFNPAAVESLPYTANSVTYTSSQIRKVNVHIGVRSETISTRTKDYLRNHLSTVVSIRNLAYVDRYK